jgi:hypothetical protein
MTIPASQIVKVNPGVVSAGGASLVLNGLFLTESLLMPTGQVLSFASAAAVSSFFGPASAEAAAAEIYFLGYNNSTVKPSAMLFAPYNVAARAGWLQSGSLAGVPLATLQAYSGILTLSIAGTPITSSNIVLTGLSYSAMAAAIQAAFTTPPFAVTWDAVNTSFIFTTTVTGATETITFATGSLAADLFLTSATGALLSQGAAVDTPATAMANAVAVNQNWVSMVPLFEPSLSNKEAFAVWFNAQNDAYVYLAWDSDVQASVQNSSEPFGVVALAAQYAGVACIGGDPIAVPVGNTLAALVLNVAVFVAGAIASLNFAQTNGRATMAFLAQTGLLPTCSALETSVNLLANGYSFYGAYATRNQGFVFFYNGNMPGTFSWIDTFIDDIWLNDQFQVALMSLVTSAGSIPYNPAGYGLVRAALLGPITAGLNFGAIRSGVQLSALQIAEVNTQAGLDISTPLQTQGWYLQILDPGATARQNRQTPVINFWYTDGGAVQQLTLASIDIL